MMDANKIKKFCDTQWDESILPSITDYIRIPNKSPAFDPQWAEHGSMDKAVALMEKWAREKIKAMSAAGMLMAASPAELGTTLVEAAKKVGVKLV